MSEASCPVVIPFRDPQPRGAVFRPTAARILSGDPTQAALNLFQSSDGRFNAGIWESEPGTWRVVFTESEFCHLIAGEIIVTSDSGATQTFRTGDAFVTPAGFSGTWQVVAKARKYYAVYE